MRFTAYLFITFFFLITALAQDDKPFTALYSGNGFDVKFIYYSEGTGKQNNGVVILLFNRNSYEIKYSFELIFRTAKKDKVLLIKGKLKANERKTGSKEDLYFIPFKDKNSIAEVGIRKVRVKKLN